jgi:hypothetical protein
VVFLSLKRETYDRCTIKEDIIFSELYLCGLIRNSTKQL